MPNYRVTIVEKIYYELYVEADSYDEVEEKANEAFCNGDGAVTDNYMTDMTIEEEM